MATILSKIVLIGDQPNNRENFAKLDVDLSSLQFFQFPESQLQSLYSKRWLRSLSRDGLIAVKCLEPFIDSHKIKAAHSRLGIYGAFADGPILYSEFEKLMNINIDENFSSVKKHWPPKQHFRQYAPLKLAHLTFLFKNQGPVYCFTNPYSSLFDALQTAEVDLYTGLVDQAIVVSAFSLEDPVLLYLYSRLRNTEQLCEAGVAFLLERSPEIKKYDEERSRTINYKYGICSPILSPGGGYD